MAETDWDSLANDFGDKYKDYPSSGVHTVKVSETKTRKASTGTVWHEFYFEEDSKYQYPKVSHPLSSKNANWRKWHWKCLFELLGATDEAAKKAVDACEAKGDYDKITAAYEASMNRLAAKHPEVEIEVWKDGKYSVADFNSSIRMNRPEEKETAKLDDMFAGSEEVEEDSSIPF